MAPKLTKASIVLIFTHLKLKVQIYDFENVQSKLKFHRILPIASYAKDAEIVTIFMLTPSQSLSSEVCNIYGGNLFLTQLGVVQG